MENRRVWIGLAVFLMLGSIFASAFYLQRVRINVAPKAASPTPGPTMSVTGKLQVVSAVGGVVNYYLEDANGLLYKLDTAGARGANITTLKSGDAVKVSGSLVAGAMDVAGKLEADASIRSASSTSNYGSKIAVKTSSAGEDFLLKFNLSGTGGKSVTRAKIWVYNTNPSNLGGVIYRTASTSWSEGTVNWSNAPAADATPLSSLGSVSAGGWYEADVTSAISGDGTYGFRVKSTSTDVAEYVSKEGAGGQKTKLVVTLGDAVAATGPVGWWKMDETVSPSVDSSGNGNSGAWVGNTASTVGKFGNGVTCDGAGDYVQVADSASLDSINNAFTVSLWVKPNRNYGVEASDWYYFVERDGTAGWQIQLGYSGWDDTPAFSVGDSVGNYLSVVGPANSYLTAGTWYHFAGVFDGTTVKLYKNGVLSGSSSFTGSLTPGGAIRVCGYTNNRFFNGTFDDLRVYSRALTAAEVSTLYTATSSVLGTSAATDAVVTMNVGTLATCTAGLCTGLVGYWNMDEAYLGTPVSRANLATGGSPFQDGLSTGGYVKNYTSYGDNGFINHAAYFDYDYTNFRFNSPFLTIPNGQPQPLRGANGVFTIAGWIDFAVLSQEELNHQKNVLLKLTTSSTTEYQISAQRDSSSYRLYFVTNGASIGTNSTFWTRAWHFVAARYDGSVLKLRVDTTDYPAVAAAPSTYNLAGSLVMGGRQGYMTGLGAHLDEIGFWDRPLTDVELTQLYNGGGSLAWPFDGTVMPSPTLAPTSTSVPPTPTRTPTPTPTIPPAACYITGSLNSPLALGVTKTIEYYVWDKPRTDPSAQKLTPTSLTIQNSNPAVMAVVTPVPPSIQIPQSALCFTGGPCYRAVINTIGYGTSNLTTAATVPAGSCSLVLRADVSGNLSTPPPASTFVIGLSCQNGDYHPKYDLSGGSTYAGYTVSYTIVGDNGTTSVPVWTPNWTGSMTNSPLYDGFIRKGISYPVTIQVFANDAYNSNVYSQTQSVTCN